jgi:hypothetical protein
MSAEAPLPLLAKIDLHGYRPADFIGLPMATIVQQAWEIGAARLRFVHGHGRARGKSPGFYNTRTGYFGLRIRRELRHNRILRQWIMYTTLDCGDWGTTTVGLKANPHPAERARSHRATAAELSRRKARSVMRDDLL